MELGGKSGIFGIASRTTDGGETWSYSILDAVLNAVEFVSPLVGWMGSSEDGLWKTTDGGATWSSQGISGTNDVFFLNSNVGWAVGPGGGIWHTTDGGATWEEQSSFTVSAALEAVQFVSASTGYAVGEDRWYDNGWDGYNDIRLLRTTDGGATWQSQSATRAMGRWWSQSTSYQRAIDFLDADTGWIAAGFKDGFNDSYNCAVRYASTVAGTTDGGATWTKNPSEDLPVGAVPQDLDMVDRRSGWLVFGARNCHYNWELEECDCWDGGGIQHTDDGGETWDYQVGSYGFLRAVHAIDTQRAFAAGDGGAPLPHDRHAARRGRSKPPPPCANLYDLFMLDRAPPAGLWAMAAPSCTPADGRDWQLQSSGADSRACAGSSFLDASRGWAAGAGGTILLTTDGGSHWARHGHANEPWPCTTSPCAPRPMAGPSVRMGSSCTTAASPTGHDRPACRWPAGRRRQPGRMGRL